MYTAPIGRAYRLLLVSAAVLALAAPSARAQAAPFHAFLLPEVSAIAVGETALVRFEVDATAQQFNAYRVTIRYRSDLVDFLPPVSEGSLMTGACGVTFQYLTQPDDSTLTYQHSILCGGAPLNGPGLLSTYRFVALADGTSHVTIVSNPDAMFADAGVWVNPNHPTFPRQVVLHNAAIQIGSTGVPEVPAGAGLPASVSLTAAPNPFRSSTELTFRLGRAGPIALEIFDVAGRRVWAQESTLEPGWHALPFAPRAADWAPLPSGTYLCRLTTPHGTATYKLTHLP